MRTWLIKVNATIYNILGGVREYGSALPWYFEPFDQIQKGDKVFFFLTDSKERKSKYKYSVVDSMFKRFWFEGEIIEIADEILNDDLKYWNDNEFRHYIESEKHRYAKIKIIRTLYDYNIRSDNVDPRIWEVKNANKDVYELDSAMESSIRTQIQDSK